MLTRRQMLGLVATAVAWGETRSTVAARQAKTTTVTLTIEGMTWEGCIAPVRSALLSVKGVSRAQVRLEQHEALVTYDPAQTKVEELLKAVADAEGPAGPRQYTAKVKTEKPAAS